MRVFCKTRVLQTGVRDAGFSVLEAIIAIAILSAAMLPLLAMQGQFVRTVETLERVEDRMAVRDSTLNYFESMNFTQQPKGNYRHGDYRVEWTATPFAPPRMAKGFGGESGRFEITLYTVAITVRSERRDIDSFEVRGLGWRAVRDFLDDI